MNYLSKEDIAAIGINDDFHIAPYRADGKTFGTLTWIWVVEVNGSLYVRAYNGKASRWFKSAISQKLGKIKAIGKEFKVAFDIVTGDINGLIDQAYKEKYGSSPYLNAMITQSSKDATIQVLPVV